MSDHLDHAIEQCERLRTELESAQKLLDSEIDEDQVIKRIGNIKKRVYLHNDSITSDENAETGGSGGSSDDE